MKKRIKSGTVLTFLRLFLLFILGAVLLNTVPVHASLTTVHVDPLMSYARSGETFNVSLRIEDAVDVYAWQVNMSYDASVLLFVNATLPPSHFLEGRPEGTSPLLIYELEQTVLLGCTIHGEYLGMSGSGILATIEFEVVGTGESVLRIEEDPDQTFLLDHMIEDLPRITVDGCFISTELLPYYDLFIALNSSYYSLLADYDRLLDEYTSLVADYDSLLDSYDSLAASFNTLTASHSSLTANYTNLQNSYDSLESSYNDLQSQHGALTGDLDTATNLNYLFGATTIAFIAATAYLAIRKSKAQQQPKTA